MKLLYLHGFRSSPQSAKAQKCLAHVEKLRKKGDRLEWYCPQLPPAPKEAMAMVMAHIESWQGHQMGIIGSSLGGFYATYIAEHKRCGAVLLNPAVHPERDVLQILQQQEITPQEQIYFQPQYAQELEALHVPVTMPERYFLLLSQDDDVLDYREAVKHYKGSEQKILAHSGHQITDFDEHVEDVFDFIGLGE